MFENKSKLWVVHIANHDAIAVRAQEEGFICIGWTKIGDLSPHNTRDKMKAAYRRAWPNATDGHIRSSYGQVYRFAHEIEQGDPVVYPIKGSRDLLIGEITGPYRWAGDDVQLRDNDYCNVRPVKWHKRVQRIDFSQDALHSFGGFSSVASSDDYLEEVIAVLKGEKVAPAPDEPEEQVSGDEPSEKAIKGKGKTNLAEQAIEETEDSLLREWTGTAQELEHVVAAVLRAMGYTAQVTQGTHDLGVDVIAHRDPLGVEPPTLKVQVKSGTGKAGSQEINALRGVVKAGEKGVFVGLGGFSNDAQHVERNDPNLILIDGKRFVELFLEFYDNLEPEIRIRFPLRRVHVFVG